MCNIIGSPLPERVCVGEHFAARKRTQRFRKYSRSDKRWEDCNMFPTLEVTTTLGDDFDCLDSCAILCHGSISVLCRLWNWQQTQCASLRDNRETLPAFKAWHNWRWCLRYGCLGFQNSRFYASSQVLDITTSETGLWIPDFPRLNP